MVVLGVDDDLIFIGHDEVDNVNCLVVENFNDVLNLGRGRSFLKLVWGAKLENFAMHQYKKKDSVQN